MSRTALLLPATLLLSLFHCDIATAAPLPDERCSQDIGCFTNAFTNALKEHDWDKIMTYYLDPMYVESQHDGYCQGDTTDFLHELLRPGMNYFDRQELLCMKAGHNIVDSDYLDWVRKVRVEFTEAVDNDVIETDVLVTYEIGLLECVVQKELRVSWSFALERYVVVGAVG